MKKIIAILISALLVITSAVCLTACDKDKDKNGKKGLLYKIYPGDEYYTVYGYEDEGEDLTTLNIAEYVKEKSGEEVTIGRIKAGAFKDNDTLKEIIVPTTVEVIDAGAFANMKALESLTLPYVGATKVADSYFNETAKAENKSVDAERNFGYIFGTEEFEGGVKITALYSEGNEDKTADYYLPITLKNVTVSPSEDYTLPMYAFAGIGLIDKITLSDKVVGVGDCAFKKCVALTEIDCSKVVKVGKQAFMGCSALDKVTFTALESLGEYAFKNCVNLRSIVLPTTLTAIPYGAFYGDTKLNSVNVGGAGDIADFAFYGCNQVVSFGNNANFAENSLVFTGITDSTYAFENSSIYYN